MINLDMDMHKSNILIFLAAVLIAPSLLVSCSTKYGSKLEASRASAAWAEGAESAEGVSETQGVIAFAGGSHRPGVDDPHWGPRPTTNGKEVG